MATEPLWLVPIQMLDACGAGTLGVAVPILVADFTWGSGRTQTALGAVATFQGIGAALSGSFGGVLATQIGWTASFLGLTAPAVAALALSLLLAGQASRLNAAAIRARV
jgi:sugar phosphate permease